MRITNVKKFDRLRNILWKTHRLWPTKLLVKLYFDLLYIDDSDLTDSDKVWARIICQLIYDIIRLELDRRGKTHLTRGMP